MYLMSFYHSHHVDVIFQENEVDSARDQYYQLFSCNIHQLNKIQLNFLVLFKFEINKIALLGPIKPWPIIWEHAHSRGLYVLF